MKKVLEQFKSLKAKHPEAILLFRRGCFHESCEEDAEECARILGITLTRIYSQNINVAAFPYQALDIYLPKLIRAGKRVAICDQMEEPTKKLVKRGIKDMLNAR